MRDALASEPILAAGLVENGPPGVVAAVACPPLSTREGDGLDLILEGFLLHHGAPRQLDIAEPGQRVLAGDYCYAQGLVRVAESGDVLVIEVLADLIAMGAAAVAEDRREALAPLWAASVDAIRLRRAGESPDELILRLAAAKRALRDGSKDAVSALTRDVPHVDAFEEVFRR